jgi:hypothetical protein
LGFLCDLGGVFEELDGSGFGAGGLVCKDVKGDQTLEVVGRPSVGPVRVLGREFLDGGDER